MSVSFEVGTSYYEIGNSNFLHAFFSTICFHLENKKWGKKYPYLMFNLYQGKLSYNNIPLVIKEIVEVKEKLQLLSPDKVVWDIDDLTKIPPWGKNISNDITDLSNYFVTSDGKNLIDVIERVLKEGMETNQDIKIVNL